MKKCCEQYGDAINSVLDERLLEVSSISNEAEFLRKLGVFIIDITGNVNICQRLCCIAIKHEKVLNN